MNFAKGKDGTVWQQSSRQPEVIEIIDMSTIILSLLNVYIPLGAPLHDALCAKSIKLKQAQDVCVFKGSPLSTLFINSLENYLSSTVP
ncbi:hypothetical protein JTE90_021374 [Oedothorax gibbosus]|uniref:Uncharacterized protein n=1 Tax=Oedothorax gibbosus TaxID=931172 RepID=A0AAV6VGY6_9ARAC|nr:hypothetical protein JTE90_021374 [Oedothorax gibbosus]